MNKRDLAAKVALKLNKNIADIIMVVDEYNQQVKECLQSGEEVFTRGFGTYQIVKRKAKIARNLSANTALPIPAKCIVKFKPAPSLKQAVEYLGIMD